jgi:Zn-dependent peptidase ImmA (M78 family)
VFFTKQLTLPVPLPDFRTPNNAPAKIGRRGAWRVEQAHQIRSLLSELAPSREPKATPRISLDTSVQAATDAVSHLLDFSKIKSIEGPLTTFRYLRARIEQLGVPVLCESVKDETFRGFCLAKGSSSPFIFINTWGQTVKTKNFTLVHELVHALLRAEGVSDPFILTNNLERFCNQVTVNVIMPADVFRTEFVKALQEAGDDYLTLVSSLSDRFKISKQATAIRIAELGLINDFYGAWLARMRGRNLPSPEDEPQDEQEIRRASVVTRHIARYGYLLPIVIGEAVRNNLLSKIDVYRFTRLKPKWLEQTEIAARKRFPEALDASG